MFFPDKDLLKSNGKGLHTVCIVDFNTFMAYTIRPDGLIDW